MQQQVKTWRKNDHLVGLVPTMGCLHEGHLSLIREAYKHADKVVVSIFVNPTQFGPNEDFAQYPRTFEEDIEKCLKEGVHAIFNPTIEDMYPVPQTTWVDEEELSKGLCGASRPGHFRGVTSVVTKLFNACLPDVAVFGQKDAQQALIIKKMILDLNFSIDMIIAPTVREYDELAMSSRNLLLTAEHRLNAPQIYQFLKQIPKNNVRSTRTLQQNFAEKMSAIGGQVDYFSVVSKDSLLPIEEIEEENTLIAVAVRMGPVRLIDNIFI